MGSAMSEMNGTAPTLLQEEEEPLGEPRFEVLVRDGEPIVSGTYFVHPPIHVVSAEWDPTTPGRLLAWADDHTEWFAEDVPLIGETSALLRPVNGSHRAYQPRL
jgi:hypothetical protein